MMNNIGRVQRNGMKIDENEVNDTVNKNQSVFRHYFVLQYFTIYTVYITSHSHDVFISLYQDKNTPKSCTHNT